MNSRESSDYPRGLSYALAETKFLLLDFDGPICSVFAQLSAGLVARRLLDSLKGEVNIAIPARVEISQDPFDILRLAATIDELQPVRIEAELTSYELKAVTTAKPTESTSQLIHSWRSKGRRLGIVSNNSEAAVSYYLTHHNMISYIDAISARTSSEVKLLKPDDYLVQNVISQMAANPDECTIIGDSITDAISARTAGCKSIGYANKPHKVAEFEKAFDHVVTDMRTILDYVESI